MLKQEIIWLQICTKLRWNGGNDEIIKQGKTGPFFVTKFNKKHE